MRVLAITPQQALPSTASISKPSPMLKSQSLKSRALLSSASGGAGHGSDSSEDEGAHNSESAVYQVVSGVTFYSVAAMRRFLDLSTSLAFAAVRDASTHG